jgi:hypothetical protein
MAYYRVNFYFLVVSAGGINALLRETAPAASIAKQKQPYAF